jgi:hypothetical protein
MRRDLLEPVGECHHDVQCSESEHDVEEGPRVGHAVALVVEHLRLLTSASFAAVRAVYGIIPCAQ